MPRLVALDLRSGSACWLRCCTKAVGLARTFPPLSAVHVRAPWLWRSRPKGWLLATSRDSQRRPSSTLAQRDGLIFAPADPLPSGLPLAGSLDPAGRGPFVQGNADQLQASGPAPEPFRTRAWWGEGLCVLDGPAEGLSLPRTAP